ncbi:hypothetical protein [Anaerosporobacter sp.]
MTTIFIEYKDMLSKSNCTKMINFLVAISNKITYSVILNYYYLTTEEYANAINDFSNETSKEDFDRRLRFLKDVEYQDTLLKIYHTHDEVLAYFERLYHYDLVELEEIKEELQLQVNFSQNNKKLKEDKILSNIKLRTKIVIPEENYLGSRFTYKSHCTIGGLYKEYYFKIDNNMTEYLNKKGNLIKFNTFKDINYLEDPGFYNNDRLICSICSHEHTFCLILQDSELDDFRLLKIPFSY